MKFYPVTIPGTSGNKADFRYSVAKEGKRFVARFNGEIIAESAFYVSVAVRAIGHSCEQRGCLVVAEQRSL